MTKESIFYNRSGARLSELKTQTLKAENGKVVTYYTVIWNLKHGELGCGGEIKQEILKEEYDYLLKVLQGEE